MKKGKKLVSLILAAGMFLLTACGGTNTGTDSEGDTAVSGSEVSTGGKVVTYAIASWGKLMPYNAAGDSATGIILDKIYDKLVYVNNEEDTIEGRAAESWELSEECKTMTFHLNKNAKWHDGTSVTAQDWLWTMQTMSKEAVVTATRSYFSVFEGTDENGIEVSENSIGVEAPDDNTLVFHFKNPQDSEIFFYKYNNYFVVLPKHLLEEIPLESLVDNEFWLKPIGSGPCTYDSEVSGSELVLNVNKDYQLGAQNFDKLVFKVVSYTNYLTSLIAGEIDITNPYISYEDAKEAESYENISANWAKDASVATLVLINNESISDARVRQAINYAIDKEKYVEVNEKGSAVASASYVLPGDKYLNTDLSTERDVDKAKELLAEAGWDSSKTLTWVVPGASSAGTVMVQENLAEVGINVEIVPLDPAAMLSGIAEGTYDMGSIPFPATKDPMWADTVMDTYLNIQDMSELNAMRDEFANATTEEDKLNIAKEYQQYCYDEMIMIPICHSYVCWPTSSRIHNVDYNSENCAIWKWSIDE